MCLMLECFSVRSSPKTFMLDDFHYVGNLNGEAGRAIPAGAGGPDAASQSPHPGIRPPQALTSPRPHRKSQQAPRQVGIVPLSPIPQRLLKSPKRPAAAGAPKSPLAGGRRTPSGAPPSPRRTPDSPIRATTSSPGRGGSGRPRALPGAADSPGSRQRQSSNSPSIRTILTAATRDPNSVPPSPSMPKIHNIVVRLVINMFLSNI